MKTEIMIAVLALLCIGSLAAFLVMWSFYDGQKKLTQEERDRRWDEISRAIGLENELDKAKSQYEQVVYMWRDIAEEKVDCEMERDALQDRLSALLCPSNNHIWKDGRCVKCGRVKDD